LILASASERRAELLRAAGFDFQIVPAGVDEKRLPGEEPAVYVERLARAKSEAVAEIHPSQPVLAADTSVVVGSQVLGKPVDRDDMVRMLRLLLGRSHQVMTGVALRWPPDQLRSTVTTTTVTMVRLSEEELAWYVASEEGADKAGGYAVQGLGSRFISQVEGSYSSVVGLPIDAVYRMLLGAGLWHYPVKGQ
jgi:septum formation protein